MDKASKQVHPMLFLSRQQKAETLAVIQRAIEHVNLARETLKQVAAQCSELKSLEICITHLGVLGGWTKQFDIPTLYDVYEEALHTPTQTDIQSELWDELG